MEKNSFELVHLLGTGSFAQTWQARIIDPVLIEEWGSEDVALKIPIDTKKMLVLLKELEINGILNINLSEKDGEHIIKYLGPYSFEGKVVMVMKYAKGGSLRDLMGTLWKKKILPPAQCVEISMGILNGLEVLHRNMIVHRDIKPENILIDDNLPKIADLGIGRLLHSNEMANSMVGALYYMSPEVLFRKEGASFNTDLWSLGITMYEMLYGKFPFNITHDMPQGEVLIQIREAPVEFPPNDQIPECLVSIIARSLEKDPKKRYQTASEMYEDMLDCAENRKLANDEIIKNVQLKVNTSYDIHEVETLINKLLKKYPDDWRLYSGMAQMYNKHNLWKKAIEEYKNAISKAESNAMLYFEIAITYEKLCDTNNALECINKAIYIGLPPAIQKKAQSLAKNWNTNAPTIQL